LNLSERDFRIGREINYQLKIWIKENYSILYPNSDKIIEIGDEISTPQLLPKDLFED
jgi:hypothetical protein